MKLLDQALDAQKNGRFQEAEGLYRTIIAADPRNFDALHMLGIVCAENGKLAEAEQFFRVALSIDSRFPPCFHNFGLFLAKQKRYQEAVEQFDRALKLADKFAPVHYDRGLSLMELGRLDEALASFDTAAVSAPGVATVFYSRGNAYFKAKNYASALQDYEKAISLRPSHAEAQCGRGHAYMGLNRYEDALDSYFEAISLNPRFHTAWIGRGNALRALNSREEALGAFGKALELDPDHPDGWLGRGNALGELDRFEEALTAFDAALERRLDHAETWLGRGNSLKELGRQNEGLAAFDRALALDRNLAEAWLGRANVLAGLRRFKEALQAFDSAAIAQPDFAPAPWNKSLIVLAAGDFADGWNLYEWRGKTKDHVIAHPYLEAINCTFRQPRRAFMGKDVLVLTEQGIGDEIMFASVLPDLMNDAKSVAYRCDRRLVELFRRSFPTVDVDSLDNLAKSHLPTPPFDVAVQIASLAYAYRSDREAFPAKPYLKANPNRLLHWKERLAKEAGSAKKIGISWRGGLEKTRRSHRSIALDKLGPVVKQDGCYFVNLQYGDVNDEIARFNALNAGHQVRCLMNDFNDFEEFAALISALDLVISVQNATIHMCGSLGKECWGMIPWSPEWRYGADGETMAWYRSVKLRRQNSRGNWDSVLDSIAADLARYLEK